jgi:hypothetical protein
MEVFPKTFTDSPSERAYTVTRAAPSPACFRMVCQDARSGVQDFPVEKAYREGCLL